MLVTAHFFGLALLPGGVAHGTLDAVGQSPKLARVFDPGHVALLVVEHILGEVGEQGSEPLVDRRELLFRFASQIGSASHESLVTVIDEPFLGDGKALHFVAFVNRLDTSEQLFVLVNAVTVSRQSRHDSLLNVRHGADVEVARVDAKYRLQSIERLAGILQSLNGVRERWWFGVFRNLGNVFFGQLNCSFERCREFIRAYAVPWWNTSVGARPWLQENGVSVHGRLSD